MDHLGHPESTLIMDGSLVDYWEVFFWLYPYWEQLLLSRCLTIEHQQNCVCSFLGKKQNVYSYTWVFKWSFVNSASFRLLTEGLANFQIGFVYLGLAKRYLWDLGAVGDYFSKRIACYNKPWLCFKALNIPFCQL